MKSRSIKVALPMTVVLAVFLSILSCGPGPQNTNQNLNQNQNQNGIETKTAAVAFDSACDEGDIETRRQSAQDKIDRELAGDDELKDGRVKILVKTVGTSYLEALVEGRAAGDDELEDVSRILRKFMKRKCVLRVSFVPTGTIPPFTSSVRGESFEWNACEWPTVACPNGECASSCPSLSPQANNNSNGNKNTNTNTNSNSNRGNGNK